MTLRQLQERVVGAARSASVLLLDRGPFLTVDIATPSHDDRAAIETMSRWYGWRNRLSMEGVPVEVVEAVESSIVSGYEQGNGLCVVADANGVRHVSHWGSTPAVQFAHWAALPSVGCVLRRSQDEVVDVLGEQVERRWYAGRKVAAGPAEVLRALRAGAVETLLVYDEVVDQRTAWFGRDPAMVARSAEELIESGVEDPWQGRLVDVAMRAAIGTGASIHMVKRSDLVHEGVGVLLS